MTDVMMLVVSVIVVLISSVLLFMSVHDHDADKNNISEMNTVRLRPKYDVSTHASYGNRHHTEIIIDQNSDVEKFSEDELEELEEENN